MNKFMIECFDEEIRRCDIEEALRTAENEEAFTHRIEELIWEKFYKNSKVNDTNIFDDIKIAQKIFNEKNSHISNKRTEKNSYYSAEMYILYEIDIENDDTCILNYSPWDASVSNLYEDYHK